MAFQAAVAIGDPYGIYGGGGQYPGGFSPVGGGYGGGFGGSPFGQDQGVAAMLPMMEEMLQVLEQIVGQQGNPVANGLGGGGFGQPQPYGGGMPGAGGGCPGAQPPGGGGGCGGAQPPGAGGGCPGVQGPPQGNCCCCNEQPVNCGPPPNCGPIQGTPDCTAGDGSETINLGNGQQISESGDPHEGGIDGGEATWTSANRQLVLPNGNVVSMTASGPDGTINPGATKEYQNLAIAQASGMPTDNLGFVQMGQNGKYSIVNQNQGQPQRA